MNRRTFLRDSAAACSAALLGMRMPAVHAEPAPEVTRLRLPQIPGICVAPQYVARDLLVAEGFTDVEYVKIGSAGVYKAAGAGDVDISMAFVAPFISRVDAGEPIVLLAGIHAGCFELFANEHIRAIRDLKGKTVAVPELGSPHHLFVSAVASYLGLDPRRDIDFAIHPPAKSAQLLLERKVDALMGFPPVPQELRARKIGHVIMNSGLDRPWSQYFCCMVGANREFVQKYPAATKRALRAILKSADLCATQPKTAARLLADRGYPYDYALQTISEIPYNRWREYDAEDSVRFYSLRLHEVGMIKLSPQKIIAQATDWRFFNELKRELKA